MGTNAFRLVPRRLHQGKSLDEQDGKNTGHEVQDHAAEEGERNEAQEVECSLACTRGALGQSTWRSMNFVGASVAKQKNSIQLRQLAAKVLVLL